MLLRFIIENIASFKEAVEFNMFPSCKTQSHNNHKMTCDHATALRMGIVYGANGAGKSNLIDCLYLLQKMVKSDNLSSIIVNDMTFQFDKECKEKPTEIAIEFFNNGHVFYYHLSFNKDFQVFVEELYLSKKAKDIYIFKRSDGKITFNAEFLIKEFNKQFMEGLDRLVRPDMLVLSFMAKFYPEEIALIGDAYQWFITKLQILKPQNRSGIVPHLLDTDRQFQDYVHKLMPELKTGISRLDVRKEIIDEERLMGDWDLQVIVKKAKANPGVPQVWVNDSGRNTNVVFEKDSVYMKTLIPIHRINDDEVEMNYGSESDGTRRLIEYMPLLYAMIHDDRVFVVDEMERSIHPIMIKDLMSKLSDSEGAKGQLIFTTHESGLLDQNIFRPDEIWFAQKDTEQATQLYPLSDFNIHKTANIENGYLNGRYGGIPFLSNLKDLHW